ncbi:hypothetical protein ABIC08_008599 [Bradyrhizobium sp. RT9b]|uniref:hypothetical protein n=1 Tax=unclassified Bradyrhizobium TaxID=2631580 RepID=UPI003393B675
MQKPNSNGCAEISDVAIRIDNVSSHGCNPEPSRTVQLAICKAERRNTAGRSGSGLFDRSLSVSPAVLVDLYPKAFRHPRHFTFASSVAGRAGRSSAATGAGAPAVPGAVRVVLANPAEIVALGARRGAAGQRLFVAGHQAREKSRANQDRD